MGQVIVSVLRDTRCSSPWSAPCNQVSHVPFSMLAPLLPAVPHSCVYPAQKNMYTYVLCPHMKRKNHSTVKKQMGPIQSSSLSHKICIYHSPVNFHVIHNFLSNRKTKKKHTEYISYFKARLFITYKVFIWRTINKNIIHPGRTPAVYLPQAPSPNIHFITFSWARAYAHRHTHTVFVGHSPHIVSLIQYNWARGKEPKVNL